MNDFVVQSHLMMAARASDIRRAINGRLAR
jgi:hypothetical protein